MEKLFIEASRKGYRFNSQKGLLTTEDLWNLPVDNKIKTCLYSIGKSLKLQLKNSEENEFSDTASAEDTIVINQLEIVRHIIKVKLEEKATAVKSADNKRYKDKLLGILADKKDAALLDRSEADILKELEALD